MVDLPKIPRRLVTSEAPKSLVTAADIAQPFADYGKALDKAGEALGDVAVVQAENEAQKAVTRDEAGDLSVALMPDFTGRAGRAHNRIAKQSYLAQLDVEIKNKITQKRLELDGRPDEFQAWAGEYVETLAGNQQNEELIEAVRQRGAQYVEQTHRGMLVQRHNRDVTKANEATDAKLLTLSDDIEKLTRQGAPREVFDATIKEFDALLNEKVDNPLIAFPREKADRFRDEVLTRAHTGTILEGTERVYGRPPEQGGGYEAARTHLRESVKALGATVKDAAKIERAGMAMLNAAEKDLRAERDQVTKEWNAARGQLATMQAEALDDLQQRARSVGAWRVDSDIAARRATLDIQKQILSLPRSEQLRIAATGILPEPLRLGGSPIEIARQFEGLHEQAHRGTIAKFIEKAGGQKLDPANTAWCAAWLNAVFRASGRPGTDSNMAKSFLSYGTPTDQPSEGDVVVLPRGDPNGPQGHVGLYAGSVVRDGKTFVKVLGGNTGNAVGTTEYPADQVLGYRRPPAAGSVPLPPPAPNDAPTAQAAPAVGIKLTQDRAGLLALDAVKDSLRRDMNERIKDFVSADRKLELPSVDEIATLGEEVHFLGTPEQKRQVAELAAQAEYGARFRDLSLPKQAEVIAAWDTKLQAGGERYERELKAKLDHAHATITNEYKRDPYGAHYQFGAGMPALPALNFADPGQMQAVLAAKATQQAQIRSSKEIGVFSAFRPGEAEAFRGFLGSATAEQVAGAFAALRGLDDEMLFATLSDDKAKEGLRGAMRSTDVAKYTAVMSGVDGIYARDPEQTTKIVGEDGWHQLKTWQSNLRYMDPKTLAEERRRAEDPQAAARRKVNEAKGQELARKKGPAEIVAAFDDAWFSDPQAPVDAATRDRLAGDYDAVFARRYEETLNADEAHNQAIEHMKNVGKWARSEINGGRLMLRAPETVYPAIGGSHDWMKEQIEADLKDFLGARDPTFVERNISGKLPPHTFTNYDYALRADRRTESEALRYDKSKPVSNTNKPPSYVVLVRDHRKERAEWEVVTTEQGSERRFGFDPGPAQEASRSRNDERHLQFLRDMANPIPGGVP